VENFWFKFGKFLCRVFCKVLFSVKVYGAENIPQSGMLVVCNHQSFLDPLFGGAFIKQDFNFLARDTLFKGTVIKSILLSVNAIPVRRGEADLGAIKTVINRLKDGKFVSMYPEATRTTDGKISAFKPGLGLICRRANVGIVPMIIDGAYECWPRHKKIFSIFRPITVAYGKPITADEIKELKDVELADILTKTLRQMQSEIRIKEGKQPYDYGV
jgi:1-acyl-sn-glycerol-3-phosphate acyltransferase